MLLTLAQAFVFTSGAGGVGITLTAASRIIMVDRDMTPGDVAQVLLPPP